MLTPNRLRKVADELKFDVRAGYLEAGQEFMCNSPEFWDCNGNDYAEFRALVREAGIERLNGTLFRSVKAFGDGMYDSSYYCKNAMPIRFMFLEFLALYLESQ